MSAEVIVEIDQKSVQDVIKRLKISGRSNWFKNVAETAIITEFVNYIKKKVLDLGIKDNGLLYRSINYRIDSADDTGINATIGDGVSYGIYHEKGSGIFAVGGDGRKTPWKYFIPGRRPAWAAEWIGRSKHYGKITKNKKGNATAGTYIVTKGVKPRPFLVPTILERFNPFMQRLAENIRKYLTTGEFV